MLYSLPDMSQKNNIQGKRASKNFFSKLDLKESITHAILIRQDEEEKDLADRNEAIVPKIR